MYKEFLADMSDCVEDLKSTSLHRRSGPGSTLAAPKYSNLNIGLHRAFWILKVLMHILRIV